MSYCFDTSPLSALFRNYYRGVFKTLWKDFEELVEEGNILSTRGVSGEMGVFNFDPRGDGPKPTQGICAPPTADEGKFVAGIFAVRHFQNNIEGKKLLNGGFVADPFVVARAALNGATVVTMETLKPNAADIPNICEHFKIKHLSLEKFMEEEGWEF